MMTSVRAAILMGCWLISAASVFAASDSPRKVIIDTDPGADDAMAILLALNSPELDVKALTVVAGNVVIEQGVENALKLVSLAGRCDIPIAGGAHQPLAQKLITAEYFHGKNGLGDVELPSPACHADTRFAPDLTIELIHRYPHDITLVPIGPLTNIALALAKDPSIVPLVKEVVLMGGSISGGNATAAAEANIYNDPEAARAIFAAGWPLTMVGLNVTERTLFTDADLNELAKTHGRENNCAVGVLKFMVNLAGKLGGAGAAMHDPLAVGAAIDRSLIATEDMRVEIETRGEFTRGETVASRHNSSDLKVLHGERYIIEGVEAVRPNAHVAVKSDARRFVQLFISRIAGK
ncbi:MAG: nucleoside hydrolase [Acidobacteriia bacterium]|nr:nucleoside hydrolase [Terriglobia bacterium]